MISWRKMAKEIKDMDASFIIACSGGVDSMVLVNFFKQIGVNMAVAHFNHGLQPINANMENFVVDYCNKYGLTVYLDFANDIVGKAKAKKTSIEAEAHKQRYAFLNILAARYEVEYNKPCYIVTGHHNGDQIESVLLNLFRGVSLDNTYMKKIDGNRFKPFLEYTKHDIVETALHRGIEWVEDPTNTDVDYDRNWLRNEIIPEIMKRRNIHKTIPLSIKKFEDKC